jgi:geranylgeranyl pyrophosphate synthase
MLMLMAHALNNHAAAKAGVPYYSAEGRPGEVRPLSGEEEAEWRERAAGGVPCLQPEAARTAYPVQLALPLQRRLAEVTELIHTASLLHDDVIDGADTRRGVSSVNKAFGNKLAVLAGDFLLARASVCLARLRNVPVVELLSTVIEHLVRGEVMQMRSAGRGEGATRDAFEVYLRKTYYKTGSLMANSAKAIGLLGCYPDAECEASYRYGLHLGIAFQLVDDMLDYSSNGATLGKPALNDIRCGLATAPVLYAAHRFPALLPLIDRKFDAPGDVEAAVKGVEAADGLALTRMLAIAHGNMALAAIKPLAPSPARTALAALVQRVLSRDR